MTLFTLTRNKGAEGSNAMLCCPQLLFFSGHVKWVLFLRTHFTCVSYAPTFVSGNHVNISPTTATARKWPHNSSIRSGGTRLYRHMPTDCLKNEQPFHSHQIRFTANFPPFIHTVYVGFPIVLHYVHEILHNDANSNPPFGQNCNYIGASPMLMSFKQVTNALLSIVTQRGLSSWRETPLISHFIHLTHTENQTSTLELCICKDVTPIQIIHKWPCLPPAPQSSDEYMSQQRIV